jgi:hypothetical protein
VLTEEEMRHFAEFRLWYEKHWIEHKAMDYEASPELPMQERYTVDIELTSPVIYLRYYGLDGVLSNGFKYIYKRLD